MLDNGCSNHMTGTQELFQDPDLSIRQTAGLGDNKEVEVACVGELFYHLTPERLSY